jgi:DNA invertase Pin-like site-specific DNA recombinase
LKNLVTTVIEFGELNVEFVSLRDHIDLTTASGRLMMHILASFAEFEASLIRERCKSGLEHAKRNGVKLGRPRTIKQDQVIDLRKQGLTFRAIANKLQISHGAVAATLKAWSQNPSENLPQTNVRHTR